MLLYQSVWRYAEYVVPGAAVTIEGKCAIKQNGDDEEEKELL